MGELRVFPPSEHRIRLGFSGELIATAHSRETVPVSEVNSPQGLA